MPLSIMVALATATAAPATKPAASKPPAAKSTPKEDANTPPMDPAQAMAMMTKIFDKLFPAGPEPDPVRLSAARGTAMTMFPKGAYSEAMVGFLDRTANRVLDMSEAELVAMFPDDGKDKKKPKKLPSTEPLRVKLAREEPNFDAKYAAVKAFATTMLTKVGDVAEPKLREGMARALARKFDNAQIAEINAFLATPTGAKYGREMVGMWFEPDVMRGAFELFPEMIKMMPELAGDAAALDAVMKQGKKPADKKK